jgi:hypothetical protein
MPSGATWDAFAVRMFRISAPVARRRLAAAATSFSGRCAPRQHRARRVVIVAAVPSK